jgi:hypothetical protein
MNRGVVVMYGSDGGFGWFEMVKDEVVEWSRVRSERW